jgi:uncharacterized protein YndB with AHSA1/START domain
MDIHHATIIRQIPRRVYRALTEQDEISVWMYGPTLASVEINSVIEIQYDQGTRSLKMEVIHLEPEKQVQWRVIQPVWPGVGNQVITWRLTPIERSTLLDFRMDGWTQDDDTFASLSYKWASFILRLRLHLGDTREITDFLRSKTVLSK